MQAVKLESARYGRTRYLVVVSCSRKPTQRELSSQQNLHLINAQNINNNNQNNNNSSSLSSSNINTINNNNNNNNRKSIGLAQQQQQQPHTATSVAMTMNATVATTTTSSSSTTTNNYTMLSGSGNLTSSSPTFVKSSTKILINGKDVIGDGSGTTAAVAVASMQHTNQIDNKNNCNEIEESCLLGIDCNEKTTVGLVLRILGDTAIRLDGDGWVWALAIQFYSIEQFKINCDFVNSFSIVVSASVAAVERTFSSQFPYRRCGRRYRHFTRCATKPEWINSIRADRRTNGLRITMNASIQIVRVSMNGMPWTRSKAGGHHHLMQFEISE